MNKESVMNKINVNILKGAEDFDIETPCARILKDKCIYVSGKVKIKSRLWADNIHCVIGLENENGELIQVKEAEIYANTKCGFFSANIYTSLWMDDISEVKLVDVLFFTR